MVSTVSGSLPVQPVQTPVSGQATPSSPGASDTPSNAQGGTQGAVTALPLLQQKLNAVLKETGYSSQVDTSVPGETVVRIMDNTTGKLVIQMPSANALIVAEAIRKGTFQEVPVESGSLFDQAA